MEQENSNNIQQQSQIPTAESVKTIDSNQPKQQYNNTHMNNQNLPYKKRWGCWKTGLVSLIVLFLCSCSTIAFFIFMGFTDNSSNMGLLSCQKIDNLSSYSESYRNIICNTSSRNSCYYKAFDCLNYNPNSTNNNTSSSTNSSVSSSNTSSSGNIINNTTQEPLVKLVDSVSSSVVTIVAKTSGTDLFGQETTGQNIGSGFIIRSNGLIVTNSHVVSSNLEYSVLLPNEDAPVPVTRIDKDTFRDIAILQIDRQNLPALKLGSSESLKRGQTVIAIGSPLGKFTGSISSGIISGLNRDVEISSDINYSTRTINGVIQTDAAINPGNSGGPLINLQGEVVGVNFATTTSASNISFAIPIDTVKKKIAEYDANGKFLAPYIGVAFDTRTNGVIGGAYVLNVAVGSPAEQAGIKKGDLIMKADGEDLEEISLIDIIQGKRIGETLKLTIWRKGETFDLDVKVVDKP